jgi:hypothetical protein
VADFVFEAAFTGDPISVLISVKNVFPSSRS